MCPKYSFSLLLWLQSFPIYLGTLKPEVKLAIPRLPCSYLISQATELKPLGRKQKCWVGPLRRLLERSLPPTFSPSRRLVILDQEVPWRRKQCCKAKRRKLGHSWLCGVAAWTLNGLFLLFFYVKKIYHPGWVPVTSRQMQFLIYTRGLPSRPAWLSRPGFQL